MNNCLVPSPFLLSPRQVLFMKGSVAVHHLFHDDTSPVPCVISFKLFGDLQNYTILERLGPTEPEK